MAQLLRTVLWLCCINIAAFTDPGCVIELECEECVPDNMPLVTSHRAANGSVVVPPGDEVTLSCGAGNFLAYPLRGGVAAACEAGRYRVRHDGALRHLLELGCQEDMFEDVLHDVEDCAPPLQGRAYRMRAGGAAGAGGARHVAAVCYDADRGVAARAHVTAAPHNALPLAPHAERGSPLSLLGNFNHMFDARTRSDAERLYSDDARMTRRLRELMRPERFAFAEQSLTSAALLAPAYFEDENARAAAFVSNRAAVWRSVAAGNLRHLQRDVARLARGTPGGALDVYSGAHGVLSLRAGAGAGGAERREAYLRAGGRFPVPRYLWTVVHDRRRARALALVVLNDPFVAVSEVRGAVFCESACGAAGWLRELRRLRAYETPLYGLAFCCALHDAARALPGAVPRRLLAAVPPGAAGMLMDFPTTA